MARTVNEFFFHAGGHEDHVVHRQAKDDGEDNNRGDRVDGITRHSFPNKGQQSHRRRDHQSVEGNREDGQAPRVECPAQQGQRDEHHGCDDPGNGAFDQAVKIIPLGGGSRDVDISLVASEIFNVSDHLVGVIRIRQSRRGDEHARVIH